MQYIINILKTMSYNKIILIVCVAISLDTFLGVLRAIKEKKFNSNFGIDGVIRKVSMLGSLVCLYLIDFIIGVNVLSLVPDSIISLLHVSKIGLCEFFCLLFLIYEVISILKNWTLCGIWLPAKLRNKILSWLSEMTGELPQIK